MWYYLKELWRSSWFLRIATVAAGVAVVISMVYRGASPSGGPPRPSDENPAAEVLDQTVDALEAATGGYLPTVPLPPVAEHMADSADGLVDKSAELADKGLDTTDELLDTAQIVIETGSKVAGAGADLIDSILPSRPPSYGTPQDARGGTVAVPPTASADDGQNPTAVKEP